MPTCNCSADLHNNYNYTQVHSAYTDSVYIEHTGYVFCGTQVIYIFCACIIILTLLATIKSIRKHDADEVLELYTRMKLGLHQQV